MVAKSVSSPARIAAFNPSPKAVKPTQRDLKELTDSEVAAALAGDHPKSVPVSIHKGMEGERTGLPHLDVHSTRFRAAHAKMGTKVAPRMDGP